MKAASFLHTPRTRMHSALQEHVRVQASKCNWCRTPTYVPVRTAITGTCKHPICLRQIAYFLPKIPPYRRSFLSVEAELTVQQLRREVFCFTYLFFIACPLH